MLDISTIDRDDDFVILRTKDGYTVSFCSEKCKTTWINENNCVECGARHFEKCNMELVNGFCVCSKKAKGYCADKINCYEKAIGAYDCPYCKKHWKLNADKTTPFEFIKYKFDSHYYSSTYNLCGEKCKMQFIARYTCSICKCVKPPACLDNNGTPDVCCSDPESTHPTCYEIYRNEYLCNCCNTLCNLRETPQYGFEYEDDYRYDNYYNICKTCCDTYKISIRNNTLKHDETVTLLLVEIMRLQKKTASVVSSNECTDATAADLDGLV
jgi:hypothetical protein